MAQILASLVRQETRAGRPAWRAAWSAQLEPDVPLLANPARHAGFVVLKAADIPSVLVEMGFMSNPQDEAALRKPKHRAQVAAAMTGGRCLFRGVLQVDRRARIAVLAAPLAAGWHSQRKRVYRQHDWSPDRGRAPGAPTVRRRRPARDRAAPKRPAKPRSPLRWIAACWAAR